MPLPSPSPEQIHAHARALGFDMCGIAPADRSPQADYLSGWLAEGKHGEMAWLARDPQRRGDPREILPGARSVIVAGLNYHQPAPSRRGRIATYALGEDYHTVLQEKLNALCEWLTATAGGEHRFYVDTGPVLEKSAAQWAGLGWQAKSTMLLSEKFGPWLFLGEILTTLDLPADSPARDRCGTCTRCLDVCPTKAITAPYEMDARRCISYLTIELKGSIPEELRPLIGDHLYGCEECLTVCPWNRFARQSREVRFAATPATAQLDPQEMLSLTPQAFKSLFAGSPIQRIKRRGLLRNACVVLGNSGDPNDLPALKKALDDSELLVREHAAWAIAQIEKHPPSTRCASAASAPPSLPASAPVGSHRR